MFLALGETRVNIRAYYGIISMQSSIFYNSFIQNSITSSGQDLISAAIYLVESVISNNEKFKNNDDIISFITNVSAEKYEILPYLDNIKTKSEVKDYIISHCEFTPDIEVIDLILEKRTSEELNKIYYKNQFMELFKNKYFMDKLSTICSDGTENEKFRDLVVDILNYNRIAWDRFVRISHQKRQASLVTDTDLMLGPSYRNVGMKIL